MALNEQEEGKVRELLTAFENGKRISDLEEAEGPLEEMHVEVTDRTGETRRIELSRAVSEAENAIAGRWWDESNATPTAAGYVGSAEALRKLPETLGLGRYLVTDDRKMRKLDPRDSRRFEDGSPAALDGTMGQCMWCWSRPWYYTTWREGHRLYEVITLKPLEGHKSQRIPVGGISWFDAGVYDSETGKLCSVISDAERYRGGRSVLSTDYPDNGHGGECDYEGSDAPQWTMLGMATTCMSTTEFGEAARKRGQGWEANWFAARAAVEILLRVVMGTRNSQADYCGERDADGLMQGGFGPGVTEFGNWCCCFPIIPTSTALEMGDGTGIVKYKFPKCPNPEYENNYDVELPVPVFYGLVFAGYGHLWRWVRGLTVSKEDGRETADVYVAPSLYADFDPESTARLKKVAEIPCGSGWISRISMEGLCAMPTEYGGTEETGYCDYGYCNKGSGLFVRCAGSNANNETNAGAAYTNANNSAANANTNSSAPRCFFTEDVTIE